MARHLCIILLLSLTLAGCFKPEIRQGNFLQQDSVATLKLGMTQAQVLALMGKPMIQDPFHPERWDYVRWVNPNDGSPIENWRVSIFFQGNLVARVDAPPPQNAEGKLQLPTLDDLEPLPETKQNNGPPPGAPPRR